MNRDDLIRFPGQRGKSHNHTYVGNRSANAHSTLDTLRSATTTCDRAGDTAAYWMPTLYADRAPLKPDVGTAYYRRVTAEPVVAFPPGFRMIAGNVIGGKPQTRKIVAWDCAVRGASTTTPATARGCSGKASLLVQVAFPSCWDGRRLDAPDHRGHLTYPEGGRCPGTRPVPLPALTLVYRFPIVPQGAKLTLASGGRNSTHADFVNSWEQKALNELVTVCLNEARACGALPPRE